MNDAIEKQQVRTDLLDPARAAAPLFDSEATKLCARAEDSNLSLWVRGPDGGNA